MASHQEQKTHHLTLAVSLSLLSLLSACEPSRSPAESEPSIDMSTIDMSTIDMSALDMSALDMSAPDMSAPDMTPLDMSPQEAPRASFCVERGLTSRERVVVEGEEPSYHFGEVAGDFTVQTTRGAWRLSEQWSGCESYVFLVYFPDLRATPSGPWVGDQVWESDLVGFLEAPENTHFFFLSFEEEAQARQDRMRELNNRFVRSLNPGESLPQERLHFVTDRATEVEGSVGAFLSDYLEFMFNPESLVDLGERGSAQAPLPFAFGIDRLQRWDAGGSLDEVVGGVPRLSMAAYLGPFYNHIAEVYERVARDGALEVPLVSERTSERVMIKTVTLPSAEELEALNTLELDVSVTCPHRNVFACSEWDRIARVSHCADEACEERRELGRWITPYWRRGERRWVWDASVARPWLSEGGEQSFYIELGPSWERATERDVSIKLRFKEAEPALRVTESLYAFGGGVFEASYNEREPFRFTPPEGVRRVELVLLLSGHGQTTFDGCAEWCDHRHHLSVNGQPLPVIKHEGNLGSKAGCAAYAAQGVSPGQYGNWAPERAFWCPGLPVEPIRVDLTAHVTPGQESQLTYHATLGEEGAPRGGDVALSAYVVFYE